MISRKDFDSDILGIEVGEVVTDERLLEGLYSFDYVVAKRDSSDIGTIHMLENIGFNVCGTLIKFEHDGSSSALFITSIRPAIESDIPELKKIVENSFFLDRYHTDKYISKEKADEIYTTWIENAVRGIHGDAVFVATHEGEIVGFTSCRISNNVGIIDLTAVDMKSILKFRLKSVSGLLIRTAVQFFHSRKIFHIETATQGSNISSIKSLLRSDFVPSTVYVVLSWRKKK